jgi:hypothetical protein
LLSFFALVNLSRGKRKAHGAGAAVGEPIFLRMGRGDWNQQSEYNGWVQADLLSLQLLTAVTATLGFNNYSAGKARFERCQQDDAGVALLSYHNNNRSG